MHDIYAFYLQFYYHVFTVRTRSVMPKHAACVNGNDTVCCGSLQCVYQLRKPGVNFDRVFVPSGNLNIR
jgi:hypothetical protein